MKKELLIYPLVAFCCVASWTSAGLRAMDPVSKDDLSLAGGKLRMTAPKGWERKTPKINMIEAEYSLPAVEGDTNNGRLTIMAAGGSIEANVTRWIGQFVQPDGSATKDHTKRDELKVAGLDVLIVDITGRYKDKPSGPFGPTVMQDNYRMLGAIIETENAGNYFVKAYGPKKTMDRYEEGFREMIKGLKVK